MNNLNIKKLDSIDELHKLLKVFSLAFESEYSTSEDYLKEMLSNSNSVILGAILDQQVIGGLIAFEMTPIHGSKEMYIYDIAVHPKHQRKGVGSMLIKGIQSEAKSRNVGTIFVEAESDDTDAVAFYRTIGAEEITVNHFNLRI